VYKLGFYVPESHLESVKSALFDAGAGRIGDYDRCCWQTAGEGQFRPLAGSDPYIGEAGRETRLPEYRVEMVVADDSVRPAVAALLRSHPYEEPAWDLVQLVNGLPD
jgi:hypothetical protein